MAPGSRSRSQFDKTSGESPSISNILGLALRSRSAICLMVCCCLIFTLQFTVIGLVVFRDHLVGSDHPYYMNSRPPPRAAGAGSPNVRGAKPSAHARPEPGPGGIPRGGPPPDPRLKRYTLEDFEEAAISARNSGVTWDKNKEMCGDLLRGVDAHHDYECRTIGGKCACQSPTHQGVWIAPTVSLLGAQKGGSTAMLAYMMQTKGYRNAIAKELHIFDRADAMQHRGVPGFLDSFDPADPSVFMEEQVGWTTPSLLYALTAPSAVKKMVPEAKFIVVLRNPVDRAMSEYV